MFDDKGKVIGVCVSSLKEADAMYYAIPIRFVEAFYNEASGKTISLENYSGSVVGDYGEASIDYTGEWALTGAQASGVTVDPTALGLEMSMVIMEDGTCALYSMGEEEVGTWVLIEGGIAVTDADAVAMNMLLNEEGALTTEQSGVTLIFTRMEYAMPLSGLTVADFNGNWTFVYAETMGQLVLAEEAGLAINLQLADGAGHIDITDANGTQSIDAVCEVEEVPDLGTVMYFLYLDETGAQTGGGLPLLLYEDGELVWLYSDETKEIFYCFEQVVE